MSIVVVGATGQLARSLNDSYASVSDSPVFVGREQLDVRHLDAIPMLLDELQPTILINATAYTAVDLAERDREAAFFVNTKAPAGMALWSARNDCKFVHISTDYVFDGDLGRPYTELHCAKPLNHYGQTKRDGEKAVLDVSGNSLIFRTSWLHSPYGKNFLTTMLDLATKRDSLRIVSDQFGNPTCALDLADTIKAAVSPLNGPELSGLYHASSVGGTSWSGFAESIFSLALQYNLLKRVPELEPIPSSEFPTPADRAKDTRLACSLLAEKGLSLPGWKLGAQRTIATIAKRKREAQ
ncbi:NAD(P)-dependent oxidoreductase [Pseudovibrio japonicus]|uniref:dTDP-4-dehydrorhamnose reductase n=1 Tax=Pseudovibrio japonicus TaxID=366534 RepID=A0ABQ3DUL8_9HYPH|nr:dTDP-4-dehydrorhamnose reductase [Pseudovibrio japonicus]GHB16951.1 NAD(P)-dependent oxidoreductase [Pseudovibrio japonicus]